MVTNNGSHGGKGVRDILGSDKIEFYPKLDRIDKASLFGNNFIIQDAKLVEDWDSDFGTTSFFLVKVQLYEETDKREVTTIMGGQALLKQLRKLKDRRAFPVSASLTMCKSDRGQEYYLLDNPVARQAS